MLVGSSVTEGSLGNQRLKSLDLEVTFTLPKLRGLLSGRPKNEGSLNSLFLLKALDLDKTATFFFKKTLRPSESLLKSINSVLLRDLFFLILFK